MEDDLDTGAVWPVILGVVFALAFIAVVVFVAVVVTRRRRLRKKGMPIRVQTEVTRVDRPQNEYE